jgi:hypothetical protein
MKLSLCVIGTLAVFSTAAMAQDIKQDQKAPASAAQATVMSDSEMDKVTAGNGASVSGPGPGVTVTLPIQGSAAIGASAIGLANSGGKAATLGGAL